VAAAAEAGVVAVLVLPAGETEAGALLLPLGSSTAIDLAAAAVAGVPEVKAVVLARRRTTPGSLSAAVRKRPQDRPRFFGAAGSTHLEALALALEVAPPSERVLVHEARRALLPSSALSAALAESAGAAAAVGGEPVTNTYKEVGGGRVRRTVAREQLVQLRGPWLFERRALSRALDGARRRGWSDGTEVAMCQNAGIPVRLLTVNALSIPITSPADVEFALALTAGA